MTEHDMAMRFMEMRDVFDEHIDRFERARAEYNEGVRIGVETEDFWNTDYPGWASDAMIDWAKLMEALEV